MVKKRNENFRMGIELWKYFKENRKIFLLILVTSLSSLWMLLFYFFSWEEFSFFYAYQNADYAATVFNAHGFSYHRIFPYLGILFNLFDYNPIPYNILSIFIFSLLGFEVFIFTKILGNTDNKTALYAGLIFAAGYYGVGTFITDTYSAYDGGFGTSLILLSLIFFTKLIKKFKILTFGLFTLSFLTAVYFFPTRCYPLPALIFIIILFKTKRIILSLLLGGLFSIPLVLSLRSQVSLYSSLSEHVDFKLQDFIKSLFENISNLFIPSMIFKDGILKIIVGFIISTVFLHNFKSRLFFLLMVLSVVGHLLVQVIAFQYFETWDSWNHFHTSFFIFAAPALALLMRSKPIFLIAIIIFNIILSNIQVYDGLTNHSNRLRYFYETIQKEVPDTDNKKVIVVFTKEPRPLSPFIHLPQISPEVYVAGFYHKRVEDLMVVQSFEEAQDYIKENNLTQDNLYLFHYSEKNLENLTSEARFLASSQSPLSLKNPTDATISGVIPFTVSFKINTANSKILSDDDKKILDYLNWAKKTTITTIPEIAYEDRKKEEIMDQDYNTTWIPGSWTDPISVRFDFVSPRKVEYLVWAVSRVTSWPQRTPTTYNIYVSEDGNNWYLAKQIVNGEGLLSSQLKKEEINYPEEIKSVRIEIFKTLEGALPAFDEVEFITPDISSLGYEKISQLIVNNQQKFCLQWKNGEDNFFRIQRQICQKITSPDAIYKIKLEPRSHKVTGFRVVDIDGKPMQMNETVVEYPKL